MERWARRLLHVSALAAATAGELMAQSRDPRVTAPVCVGACPRVIGLRLNWRDDAATHVHGINATVWTPRLEADGRTTGISVGLPIAAAGNLDGIAIGPLAGQITDRLRGLGVGGLAVGADRVRGALVTGGLGLSGSAQGFVVSGLASIATSELHGSAIGAVLAFAGGGWGISAGGVAAYAGGGFRGLTVGGLGVLTGSSSGVALASAVHKASDFRGVSVALVNYARRLRGVQLGALNIVSDGRSPRVMPFVNWR